MSQVAWDTLKRCLASKKFVTMLIGLLVTLGVTLGLDEAKAEKILEPLVLIVTIAIGAQGVADIGKEKAKIEAGE
jgi:hypothetical protein